MSQGITDLLGQGLAMTVVGMGLVFGALTLLWGAIALLGRIFRSEEPDAVKQVSVNVTAVPMTEAEATRAAVTSERARVAAIVAGALMANAVSLHLEPSAGPTFEHGRTAPAWVTTNRARVMRPWQPPRATER